MKSSSVPPTRKLADKKVSTKPAVKSGSQSATKSGGKPRSKALKETASKTVVAKHADFHIVGIGASAGGLEAIEQFLSKVPADINMAFIVVQHLDPNVKDMLSEILQRDTPLRVEQISEGMLVEPGYVYVIPPAYDLSIRNDILHLLAPKEPRGLHLAIDFFFRSLAADQKERSIAVILSGMGSDGTIGLHAIKEQGGAVFVQSPASAKFDGMPRSAISTGEVDVVAAAEELMEKIISYVPHEGLLRTQSPDSSLTTATQEGLERITRLLYSQMGHDFSLYKKNTILRRVERRMDLHKLSSIADYARYLLSSAQEIELLFKELLIGVTSFFRDPGVWEQLKTKLIPELLEQYPDGGVLRAWVPGCSTGEEAYTLAMIFQESLAQVKSDKHFSLQIFATDLDREAIELARVGSYSLSISADVSEQRLKRFFVRNEDAYRIAKEVREMVIFAPQNLVMDPPFTRLDLLSCRNLLIYLEADLQQTLFPLFHYSLNSGGVLVLGTAETIGSATELFEPCSGKKRIYIRRDTLQKSEFFRFPATNTGALDYESAKETQAINPVGVASVPDLETLINALLLDQFTPAALLATEKGDIVYIHGKTGAYLEPAAGKVNHNLFAMARESLSGLLSEAFHRAARSNETVELQGIVLADKHEPQAVDVSVQVLGEPEVMQGMVLVVFRDVASPIRLAKEQGAGKQELGDADQMAMPNSEIERARTELESSREEMHRSQEELKSSNEELQSINEELQSINEELTTSKEEMQSMNEELQTVNYELNAKVSELTLTSDDMNNLLNSTDIATLFLDNDLKVRRFTTQTTSIINLIPSDIGRPITDLVSALNYSSLADDAREVLRSLIFHEVEVSAEGGRWYCVRIMPYRTQENRIDGVVITFVDDTERKQTLLKLVKSESRFHLLFENSLNAVAYQKVIFDTGKPVDLTYLKVNKSFSEVSGLTGVEGKNISELMPGMLQSSFEYLAACGRVSLTGKTERIEYYEERMKRWYLSTIYSQEKGFVVSVSENVTAKKHADKALREIQLVLKASLNGLAAKPMSETEINQIQTKMKNLLSEHFFDLKEDL